MRHNDVDKEAAKENKIKHKSKDTLDLHIR